MTKLTNRLKLLKSSTNSKMIELRITTYLFSLQKIEPLVRGAAKILSYDFQYLHPPLSY